MPQTRNKSIDPIALLNSNNLRQGRLSNGNNMSNMFKLKTSMESRPQSKSLSLCKIKLDTNFV